MRTLTVSRINTPLKRKANKIRGSYKDVGNFHVGNYCFVVKQDKLDKYCPYLRDIFPNKSVTLKVWDIPHRPNHILPDSDITTIQNIGYLKGFAPRVYEEIKVRIGDKEFDAQIIEYLNEEGLEKDNAKNTWKRYAKKLKKQHISTEREDGFPSNFKGKKLIDFGGFYFNDKMEYYNDLLRRFQDIAFWGSPGSSYQNIPTIDVDGGRKHDRFELLGMNELDLTGKTVLDLGCSGGQSLYWAVDRGAERVVGVDTPEVADITFEMANYHGYHQIETVGADLREDNIAELIKEKTGISEFDYVIIFSINHHVGFHKYMRDLCKDTLFLETNAAKFPEEEKKEYQEEFKKLGYTEFEYRGQVDESGGRSLFICK